jgi:hypothetical protein
MRVELFPPDSDTATHYCVQHDQVLAMMLQPGSIEWGSKRSALEKFDYGAGDLALCPRHEGHWVGLMNVLHLQLGISDAALMASSGGAYGEVELCPSRKFADPRLSALVAAVELAARTSLSRVGVHFPVKVQHCPEFVTHRSLHPPQHCVLGQQY